jgi:hypothetical protein
MVLLGLAQLAAPASAGNVAIVAAAGTASSFSDPQSKIMASGFFGQVDIINAQTTTPALLQLQAYDAVIVWSNMDFQNPAGLGDVLADYVDAGGGVVVTVFANSSTGANRHIQGRWLTGGYPIIVPQGGTTSLTGMAQTLGVVHIPAHPVMNGVSTFNGGTSSFRPTTTAMTAGASLIASWSDGKIFAAQHGVHGNRIDLGFYPPSNAVSGSWWDQTTDGGKLMANALLFVSAQPSSSTSFCSGDGSGTACPCGNAGLADNGCASSLNANGGHLGTTGTASLANDTLVLAGSGMPDSSALYFQGTTKQNGGMGTVFGDGLRCAAGMIVRIKTVTNAAGASQYPQGGDASVSVRGAIGAPGTRTYQIWYRNAAAFCTRAGTNSICLSRRLFTACRPGTARGRRNTGACTNGTGRHSRWAF